MHAFRPTRCSPPPRPRKALTAAESLLQTTISADGASSSSMSVPSELAGLSADDVEVIDAIIHRAGPTATTFLTIFKAYSDVLHERGLDSHEVLYYGKLLKLGTLRGRNWRDKWIAIKNQCGYDNLPESSPTPSLPHHPRNDSPTRPGLRALNKPRTLAFPPADSVTVHSHENDDYQESPEAGTPISRNFYPGPRSEALHTTTNSLGLEFDNHPLLSAPARQSRPISAISSQIRPRVWDAETDNTSSPAPTSIPPSYRAAVRQPPSPAIISANQQHSIPGNNILQSKPKVVESIPRSPVASLPPKRTTEQRGSIINEEDAWNKVKMLRDEKEADRFREERLVERCWDVWRQGFDWIITTHEQIGQARDNLLLRVHVQRWREKTAARTELLDRVTMLANNQRLRAAFHTWKIRMKERQQAAWRHSMRSKMKTVRDKHDAILRKDAWAKWRQSYKSHLAEQHYAEHLVMRFYQRWKDKVSRLEELNAKADEHFHTSTAIVAEQCWERWVRSTQLSSMERTVKERVGLRVVDEVITVWKRRMRDMRTADVYNDTLILKHTIKSWKTARDRIRALESKADRHVARQDDVLLRAVARVWKAHERGRLLERVRGMRLLKVAWSVWKERLCHNRDMQAVSISFFQRPTASYAVSALNTWKNVLSTHRNAHSYALDYCSSHLALKTFSMWKMRWYDHLRLMKKGRTVQKYLLTRRAWTALKDKYAERKRYRLLQQFENRMREKYFRDWHQRAVRERHNNLAEAAVQRRIKMRLLQTTLGLWTNRVIDLKVRELEVMQRYEVSVLLAALTKWKRICSRHAEELRLMQSYQYIKREENMRKMFYRWLSAARAARHRRVVLREKEDEMKLATIAVAWDKWRDRFKDERLRPLEYEFLITSQKSIMFKVFTMWHSKTHSLPAIRFHVLHTKQKVWKIWRHLMPRAMQAKKAREMDKKAVLSKFLTQWAQTYRSKVALKAVARARYLRLPSAAPRKSVSRPLLAPWATAVPKAVFPRRVVRGQEAEDESEEEAGPSRPTERPRWASPFAPRPRSETSPPPRSRLSAPSKSRDPSPVRSTKSSAGTNLHFKGRSVLPQTSQSNVEGEGRSRLWTELQALPSRRSRPPSERSRTREPP